MGWKLSLLHLAAILLIVKSDSPKPNPAAIFLLLYISIALVVVITSFNPNAHVRQMWPPFHVLHNGEDPTHPFENDILQEVDFFSSDSEEEDEIEEHLPPNLFLEGPFLLGPPHPPVAAIAG